VTAAFRSGAGPRMRGGLENPPRVIRSIPPAAHPTDHPVAGTFLAALGRGAQAVGLSRAEGS